MMEPVDLEQQPLMEVEEVTLTVQIKMLSEKPLSVEVYHYTTVSELKDVINEKLNLEGKFLRLIYQGKMLSDDKLTLDSYHVKNNDFIHCAVSAAPPKCVVEETSATEQEEPETVNRRGFDRLHGHLSREEIQALRLHFYPQISALINQSLPVEGESAENRIYRIEEEWISSQGPQSEFALNILPRTSFRGIESRHIDMPDISVSMLTGENEGSYVDMIWGVLMGLLLGFFMLFLLWERTVPRRQKLGIIIGVSANLMLSMIPKAIPE